MRNTMNVREILEATGGTLLSGSLDTEISGFNQDTRKIQPGDMYIPLIGEVFDGHQFIQDALDKGAIGVIVANEGSYPEARILIKVEDTLKALWDMASYLRRHRPVKVVAITGSVGKTSTKDMVYSVVSKKYRALKTLGNYNNTIGLPLTILRLKDEEVLILEMGMDQLHQIEIMSKIAKPDIAIITNVGTAHIGKLGSREAILQAKMEIISGMENGTLIINDDNDLLSTITDHWPLRIKRLSVEHTCDYYATDIQLDESSSSFMWHQVPFQVGAQGMHFVYNALVALAVGETLEIPVALCQEGIAHFELTKKRMDILTLDHDIILIDGSYNANLDSMKSSLEVLSRYHHRRIAVLSDMLELGDYSADLHRQVGEYVAQKNIDMLLCVGKESRHIIEGAHRKGMKEAFYFENNEGLFAYLKECLIKNDVVLVKGSNGMHLSDVVMKLKEALSVEKKKLVLVLGGQSTEHSVSRMSATSIYRELNKEHYDISLVGIDLEGAWHLLNPEVKDFTQDHWLDGAQPIQDIYSFLKEHDVAFPALHGLYGEDGTIQGLFEMAKIPYVGCRVLGSCVSMDKIYTKIIFEKAGIPQVRSIYIKKRYDGRFVVENDRFEDQEDVASCVEKEIGYPCFVKPSNSGSSVGVRKVTSKEELMETLTFAAKYDRKLVIEESIDCIELECAVLGNDDPKASLVGQILPHGEFYTFESKYEDEESATCIPARVDQTIQDQIRLYAVRAFKAVDGHGLSRVDFFLDKQTGKLYLNEINTLPGFTNISMYPQLWEATGLSYSQLLDRLVELAFEC